MKDKAFLNQLELRFNSSNCRIRDLEIEVRRLRAELKRNKPTEKLT